MKSSLDYWKLQRQREIKEYTKGWDWGRILAAWTRRLDDFKIVLNPLFLSIPLHDPANPTGRRPEFSWWPVDSVPSRHRDCQRHLDKFPGTFGLHNQFCYPRRGELDTLDHLWESRDCIEKISAILIAASLFSRIESTRGHYPDGWLPRSCAEVLQHWAYTKWLDEKPYRAWHYSCTEVLPYHGDDWASKIDSMRALIRYLAEEHAATLLQYRPVVIEFLAMPDHDIAMSLKKEYAAENTRNAEWSRKQRYFDAKVKEKERCFSLEHPRWREWHTISKDELQRLVWSKPTTQLAKEFGVSDVAIAKRCRAVGIRKPPLGFWRKVEVGLIPHPHGVPGEEKP